MTVEILFNEVCGLYGDSQNATYLQQTLPDAQFIYTPLTDDPYFLLGKPDLIYIGSMSENTQRAVLKKLLPIKARIAELIDCGTPMLATGNAAELFAKDIHYLTENTSAEGLGIFDLTVRNDLFDRYNGKVIGTFENMTIVGFRSQFSFLFGDNTSNAFVTCQRGVGINRDSKLEGMRKNNLICTQILGPLLPLNPEFCEYFISLCGVQATAAHRDAAMQAYLQRVKEFLDPNTVFGNNK